MRIQYDNFNFRAKTLPSKERILSLQSSGKKYTEIVKELEISETTYNALCAKYDIVSEMQKLKQHIASIMERFKAIAGKKPMKEVCEELNITERTYSRLINTCEILTERKKAKLRARAITPEYLQELVDNNLTVKEIGAILGVNKALVYRKFKEFNTNYNYQHHYNERRFSAEVLARIQEISKTVREAADNLEVAVTTYHAKVKRAGVKTVYRDSIDKLNSISPEEFQKAVETMTVKEICKKFNITEANYTSLIRRYNTKTPHRASMERIANITKEELLKDRAEGKMIKTICAERGIGLSTYRRIINKP